MLSHGNRRGRSVVVWIGTGILVLSGLIADPKPTTAAGPGEFALAPGDTVRFDVLDDDKEPVELLIAADGTIQAPFLGAVKIDGFVVSEALEEVKRQYVEKGIFLDPRLGLSVAQYRPIYVIGDVRSPGSYPFAPKLTVEKAMGLAGGQITVGPSEDPILVRARIRGELESIRVDIIREALAYARLSAQLDGRSTIEPADIPVSARPYMEGGASETLGMLEQQILTEETKRYERELQGLAEQISEAEKGIGLLEELYDKLNQALEFSREDLKRAQELQRRGIQTLSGVSNIERQLAMEEARLLQVLSDMSSQRSAIGTLKRQSAELEHKRKIDTLTALQTHSNGLTNALGSRRIAEEQLVLLSAMAAEDRTNQNKEVVLDYTIRRELDGLVSDLRAAPNTPLAPGDVLIIRIRDQKEDVAALPGSALPAPQ